MDPTKNVSVLAGIILISLGALFMVLTLSGLSLAALWPIIFFVIGAGFVLPGVIWPHYRVGLAALYIPAAVMFTLGLIFLYNTITRDWAVWAYAWLLIPGGVGAGLALASHYGGWGRTVITVGVIMLAACVGLFGLFATLFGSTILRTLGAGLVIVLGIVLIWRSMQRPTAG